ncbi:peptidoglycan-binding domain-containing protein [Frondihabitans cladoniiphilus]|uniref:Peptidoglycan binding protein n=1 Tax=Frondihabitans cladoniiphilus TaxID=715785 RepID=A0ABP8W5E8_9MICO
MVAFVAVMAVVLSGAFTAGLFVKAPTDAALEAAESVIPVIAEVEERVVSDGFAIPARLTAGATFDVVVTEASVQAGSSTPGALSGSPAGDPGSGAGDAGGGGGGGAGSSAPPERVVVTATAVAPGDTIRSGRLLGEVSGRPVFALPAGVPLYRDLLPGSQGKDVSALQRALVDLGYSRVRPSGTLDPRTLDALRRLFEGAGYRLPFIAPGVQGVALREFASIPTSDPSALTVAPVGTALSAEQSLLRLQISPAVFTATITTVQKSALGAGTPVGVAIDGASPQPAEVLTVGAFTTDPETEASGYPITVSVPAGRPLDGATIQLVPLDIPAPVPAVPAVALHQGADGSFVIVMGTADPAKSGSPGPIPSTRKVAVDVTVQKNGWAAIEANPDLPVGTRLVVNP